MYINIQVLFLHYSKNNSYYNNKNTQKDKY